jgi:Mrp family chromosome partitioning ATPase
LNPKTGLANILVGNTAPSEAILQTKITGLDLLPMGDASLIGKSRIMPENHVELMQWVSRNYSMVFVDLPQIEHLRHALLIAKANDLTLVAVRSDSVPRDDVVNQVGQLVSDGVEVTGTILTRRRIYTPRIFR